VADQWAYENDVEFHFIDQGKPTQNAYIESFNGKFRDECLNQNCFPSLVDARKIIEEGRATTITARPHSSLGYRTPIEFATRLAPPLARQLTCPRLIWS
jgi:putative transposase